MFYSLEFFFLGGGLCCCPPSLWLYQLHVTVLHSIKSKHHGLKCLFLCQAVCECVHVCENEVVGDLHMDGYKIEQYITI